MTASLGLIGVCLPGAWKIQEANKESEGTSPKGTPDWPFCVLGVFCLLFQLPSLPFSIIL